MTPVTRSASPNCPYCHHHMLVEEMLAFQGPCLFKLATDEGSTHVKCPACTRLYAVKGGYFTHYDCAMELDDI